MTGAGIFLLVLGILFLLGQIPLAVGGSYSATEMSLWANVGLLKIPLFPRVEKAPKEEEKSKKKSEKKKKSMTVPQIIALVLDLLPVVQRATGSFLGKLKMDELFVRLIIPAADDPAEGAIRYSQGNALLATLWVPLVDTFHIQEGSAGLDVDFTATELSLTARGTLSIKLGQLLIIVLAFAINGLRIFLRHRRQNKRREAVL